MTTESQPQTRLSSARGYLQRRHYWLAIPELEAALAENPGCVDALELLGIAQSLANNQAAARRAFLDVTRLEPARVSGHFNFALFLFGRTDYDEAVEEVKTALYLEPTHAGAVALEKQLLEKMKFRSHTAEEGFALVGSAAPNKDSSPGLRTLECPTCGGMNMVMAKVCKKCNSYIPEMPEIVPVE